MKRVSVPIQMNSPGPVQVASSLISAGLGLLFSTPACSEADTESLHEYQQVGSLDSDECDEDPVSSRLESGESSVPMRRESGVSIASGIYEEIADGDKLDNTNHYENPATLHWGRAADSPPPLPPRKQTHNFLQWYVQARSFNTIPFLPPKTSYLI
jgi:hypothetical protein